MEEIGGFRVTGSPEDRPIRSTIAVDDSLFKEVYDSPQSLPGKHTWVTPDHDVRKIEELLGLEPGTIGNPLWLSGDSRTCPGCQRGLSWLDIVHSAAKQVHTKQLLINTILGQTKYVNVEAPEAIANVRCVDCDLLIENLRSFKCHNWAYARDRLAQVVREAGKRQQHNR